MLSNFAYSTNAIGQRYALTTSGSAFTTAPIYSWGYNSRGELVQADDTSASDNDRAYQYDGIGNREKTADGLLGDLPGTPNYEANALNEYELAAGVDLTASSNVPYDADGNYISGTIPVDQVDFATLEWDGENRLVKVTKDGGDTIECSYDYLGRRITKISTISSTPTTTNYIYDGWNLVAEYTGTTLAKSYTWGMDLSGSMQGAGGVGGLLSVNDGSATYYPTYDGNGNVSEYLEYVPDDVGTTMVDEEGVEVVAHYEYDAFGNTTYSSFATGFTATSFAHQFSTKYLDAETGLYYYGYRYYDPVTGRWPSRDPIQERGGLNLYGFVGNDGVNSWDFLGMEKLWYSSDQIEIGDCGSFRWKIYWKVSPISGNDGGAILQEMSIVAFKGPDLAHLTQYYDEAYHEAWRVKPKSADILENVRLDPNGVEIGINSSKDTWWLGKNGDWKNPHADGTIGHATFQGWARYRNGVSLSDLNTKMPVGSESWAGDLWSSKGSVNPGLGGKASALVYRKIKVSWCCTPGATADQRKTKVEILPKSDSVYLP